MRETVQFIEELVKTGEANGLTAEAIAARAGLKPSNLSRIRKTGKFNADTLERLLAAVDCRITLAPRPTPRTPGRTLSLVYKKLNAGRQVKATPEELRALLLRFRSGKRAERLFTHLVGVVEELPVEQVHSLVIEGDAALPALKRIADYVDGEGPTVDWINEQLHPGRSKRNWSLDQN